MAAFGDAAQAEAMELELRYTLESFEGQLSAMAREKVALQKQVKELTGQCGTVRKQVGETGERCSVSLCVVGHTD